MTQRLSTSATFQSLQTRVQTLEQLSPLPSTLANNAYLRASTASGIVTRILGVSGTNTLYLGAIDTSFNSVQIANGASSLLQFDGSANATFGAWASAPGFSCAVMPGAGSIRMSRAFSGGYTGIVEFLKSDGSRNAYVGFNPEAGAMQYGSDTGAGHNFVGGEVAVSANIAMPNGGYLKTKKADGTPTRVMGINGSDALYIGGIDAALNSVVFEVATSPTLTLASSAITLFNDSNLGFTVPSGNPRLLLDANDYLSYDRSNNQLQVVVGGTTIANINLNYAAFPSVQVSDANFTLAIQSSSPRILFDANDALVYDRTANKYYFVIGGINVASIDANGNMRLKGTLTQSVTP